MKRRNFIAPPVADPAAEAPAQVDGTSESDEAPIGTRRLETGRLQQSVCRWCFSKVPLDALCKQAAAMGFRSVELLGPDEWTVAAKHGLTCALASAVKSNPIPKGFNRTENHDGIIKDL